MKENRAITIAYFLHDEGSFVQRSQEPGGCGNHGISMAELMDWRHKHGKPVPTIDDMRALTADEASDIYSADYLDHINFDALQTPVDYAGADCACNEGVHAALILLHVTAGISSPMARVQEMSRIRLAAKRRRPDWGRFGKGWTNRIGIWVPARAQSILDGNPLPPDHFDVPKP